MIGIVIFLVGSALSGLSQNMGMLILFRGIQGIGAGALFPVALAVIGDLFTPAGARQVPGPVRGRVRHRVRRRPAHRRLPDRERQLALDLLRQHPDRDRRAGRHPAAAADGQDASARRATSTSSAASIFTVAMVVPAGRPDQQAVRRLDRADRRRVHPRRHRRDAAVHLRRVARQGADRPARPVRKPDLLGVDGLGLLRRLRVLRRDRLPAALVPGRRGLLADQLRPGGPAADGRPDRQLDRRPA